MQETILPPTVRAECDEPTVAIAPLWEQSGTASYAPLAPPQNVAPAPAQAPPWHLLPQELQARPQWLLAGPNEKGELKVPCSIGRDLRPYPVDNKDASAWMTFVDAVDWASDLGYGIGYCLCADDPYTCVDLDVKDAQNAPDMPEKWTTPEQLQRYQSIVQVLNSYTEFSRSGKGVHVWCYGNIGPGLKRDGVEVYSQERFIACTGNVLHARSIVDGQDLLTQMVSQMRVQQGPAVDVLDEVAEVVGDAVILEQARSAANSEKFNALWAGQWQARPEYPSQSEADMALMFMLAFYTASNEQCRRLFRLSALGQREKSMKDDRYLDLTLKKVRGQLAQGGSVEHGRKVAGVLLAAMDKKKNTPAPKWARVSVADVCTHPAAPVDFLIEDLLPAREVTLLPADGGAGKSLLTLIAAVCQAMGLPFMGKKVTRCKAVFYSAEDDARVLRGRLRRICEHYGVNATELAEWLLVVDANDNPCLFEETYNSDEGRQAGTTRNLDELDREVREWGARVVVIDNASDTYDANENVRQYVRGFVKGLKDLAKKNDAAVWLLAHLDKASVRGEGGRAKFSGSTAWHNSVRSRLLLGRNPNVEGQLVLSQEKSNHGRMSADIFLAWSTEGVLMHAGGGAHTPAASLEEVREQVLGLIREHYERGQYISDSLAANAPTGAFATLSGDPNYPRGLDKARLANVLRQAVVHGLLEVEHYVNPRRHTVGRWHVL